MNRQPEQYDGAGDSNGHSRTDLVKRRLTWTAPLLPVTGRSALIPAAQGLVAVIFAIQGNPAPWRAAAPWWTIYGHAGGCRVPGADVEVHASGGNHASPTGGAHSPPGGRDLFVGIGLFLLVFPLFVSAGLLSGLLLYGTLQAGAHPGIVMGRVLPGWAIAYSLSFWWVIWSPTEEMTYQAYALPRIEALSGRSWVAVGVVTFWWALQHSFLPFIADWRFGIWRFVSFVPGVIALTLIYLAPGGSLR